MPHTTAWQGAARILGAILQLAVQGWPNPQQKAASRPENYRLNQYFRKPTQNPQSNIWQQQMKLGGIRSCNPLTYATICNPISAEGMVGRQRCRHKCRRQPSRKGNAHCQTFAGPRKSAWMSKLGSRLHLGLNFHCASWTVLRASHQERWAWVWTLSRIFSWPACIFQSQVKLAWSWLKACFSYKVSETVNVRLRKDHSAVFDPGIINCERSRLLSASSPKCASFHAYCGISWFRTTKKYLRPLRCTIW